MKNFLSPLFFSIFQIVLFGEIFAQNFTGTYQIGSSAGADYPTITAAIGALRSGTVTGDVVFQLEAGTYQETIDLSTLNNGSFTLTIDGVDNTTTTIHPLTNITADKSGISITGTDHVVLKNFTLEMDDISSSRVFYDEDETRGIHISGASDIDLESLVLSDASFVLSQSQRVYIASAVSLEGVENISISSSNLSGAGLLIFLHDFQNVSITDSDFSEGQTHIYHSRIVENDADALTIDGNTFTGPFPTGRSAAAISLFGRAGTASSYSSNLVIKDNFIDTKVAASDDDIMGIYAQGQVDAEVSNNEIHDGSFGIRFDGSFSSKLASNQVYGPSNYGLYLQLGGQLDVINNIFTSSRQTAFISAPADIRLAHNTFYASGTQPALYIFRESGDSLVVVNNLFHVENTVGSEVTITDVTASDIRIDHNLYSGNAHTYTVTAYRLGATIGVSNSGLQYYAASLSDWQTNQALYDQNSRSFTPSFAGAPGGNDYHITDGTNYRFGTPIYDITSDIDGDYRDVLDGIDVGADQYCSPTCLPPVPPTLTSFSPTSGPVGTQVTLTGTNFDATPASNVVFFGATRATIVSASSTQLVATVPPGATYEPITVLSDGLAAQSLTPFQVTFESDGTLDELAFDASLTFSSSDDPGATAIGDLDNDGLADMVVYSSTSQTMSVFKNTSSGPGDINFATRVDYAITASAVGEVILEDFNGDGRLDVAIGSSSPVFSIFENTSDGSISFATRQDFATISEASSLAASDINLDGKIDLLIAEYDGDQVLIFENTSIRGSAIRFSNHSSLVTGDGPTSVVVEDMDHDGRPDIVVGNDIDATVSIFLKDGTPFGYALKQDFATPSRPDNVVTGDIDGDGKADIVVAANAHALHFPIARLIFLLNTSTPGTLSFVSSDLGTAADWVDLDDLNGDGILDFAYVDGEIGPGWMGNPDNGGNFSLDDEYGDTPEVTSSFIVTADLDNDSEPDLIMPGFNHSGSFVEVKRNLGSGTDFKSFSMDEQLAPAVIDANNHTISIDVVACTDLTSLIPEFELSSKATTTVSSVSQQSGVTANDYSSALIYKVTSEDGGSTQNWTVTVSTGLVDNFVEHLEACESFEFDGNTLTASGQYFGSFTNVNGCDSLVTLNLTILEPTSGDDHVTVCESYEWEGTVYTASGTYQEILTNSVGCDSTATLNLTILEATSGDDAVAVCESYVWEGNTYTASGIYQEILTNAAGCDSTATLNLTILQPTSGDDNVEACESYEWEGTVYTVSGTYQEILTNAAGCDSTATLNLTILEPTSGDDNVEACESYEWEGTVYTVSGTYQEILTNAAGCDSTATLNLTILQPTSGDDNVEACESYEWEGTVYTASGSYQEILTNAEGCDSTATLNLTILEPTSGDDDVEACESYTWQGTVYTASGTYQEILTNAAGCDSTATLNLTILEPTSGDDNVEACESYEWEGTVYTASGTYQEILTNAAGCDSTATLNLTILEPTSGDDDVEACESYTWQGTAYTASGTYQEILTNAAGCDSTATLNLTILEPTSGDDNVEACESYEWQGTVYTASGTYQEILTNAAGCDSTATLNLTILEPTSGDDDVEACESYTWQGTVYTASGTYQEILTNAEGCDSTATLNLTILEPTSGDDDVEACESYIWEGTTYTTSGTYQEVLTNAAGCDSTATLNLTILEPTSGDDDVEACESYAWNGTTYTASGTYQEILTNAAGCDSTATLNLTILEPTSGDEDVEACESYAWNGTTYTASGTYEEILTNAAGCDSTATLNLTILEPTSGDENVEVCESYVWEGTTYTTSGTYQEILTNAAGCDSTATLNLTILGATSGEQEVVACGSYEWHGTRYESSGQYEVILTNAAGCDSIATLDLTIGQDELEEVSFDACGEYTFGSQTITESGLYQETFSNAHGCDSTVLLTIGILPEPEPGIVRNAWVLSAEDGSPGLTYQWIDCTTEEKIEGATNRDFTPGANGNYAVQISNGLCTIQTDCFDVSREGTVLSTDPDPEVMIYPNPTAGQIKVSVPFGGQNTITIMSMDGKVLKKEKLSGPSQMSYTLPRSGTYLIQTSYQGQSKIYKVRKQ